MTAPTGAQSPIQKQPADPVQASATKKRQPRGIEKGQPEPAPSPMQEPELEIEMTDGVELGDNVFADVIPGPPAPNTQPPTEASRAAVAREAVDRRRAIRKGLRDQSVGNRLFSGENATRTPKERAGLLSARHDQYTQLMALNCIKPLAQGIDLSTLIESVSSAAVMWALSPRFRELTADYNTKINDALRFIRAKNFEDTAKVPLGSSRAVVELAKTKAQRADREMLDQVSAVLQGSEEVPFSTESAAMSLLQIHEDAYVAIREGADEGYVLTALSETVDELTQVWKSQKLDPQLVIATARTLTGHTEDDEDLRLAQFTETASGSLRPSAQTTTPGAGGAATLTWGGQWALATGGMLNSAESPFFTVRSVQDARSHQDALGALIFQDLQLAAKSGPAELRKAVIGHLAAWELRDTKLDNTGVGGASRDRAAACAQRSRVAFAAMADDGITEEIRQKVAANALLNGMTAFESSEPEVVAAMAREFGESHNEAVAEMVKRGKERGRPAPLKPVVFNPSNPTHAAQMADYTGPGKEPEAPRDLGVQQPRATALAPWGPRAHQAVLDAENARARVVGREGAGPARVDTIDRPQPVRQGVDKQQPSGTESRPPTPPRAVWRLVRPEENVQRRARGYETVERVPLGMKPVPADWSGYQEEIAKRADMEAAEARLSSAGSRRSSGREAGVPQATPTVGRGGPPSETTPQSSQSAATPKRGGAQNVPPSRPAQRWAPDPVNTGSTGPAPQPLPSRPADKVPPMRTRQQVHGNSPRSRDRSTGPELGA